MVSGGKEADVAENTRRPMKWWATDRDGDAHEFFASSEGILAQVIAEPGGDGLVGISRGKVWRISKAGTPVQDLTIKFEHQVSAFELLQSPQGKSSADLVLTAHNEER